MKLRQPLRALVVEGAPLAETHADEIADELRVREVSFGQVEASELRVKPNLPAARAEARQGARCCARGAPVRRLRGAFRRRHPRRGSRAHARRGARRAGGQGRLGGCSSGRGHCGARPAPRRRARPRRPRLRPHPRGELAAQGDRSRDHRSDPADDPRGGLRSPRARGVDRARDARRLRRRGRRRARPREGRTRS